MDEKETEQEAIAETPADEKKPEEGQDYAKLIAEAKAEAEAEKQRLKEGYEKRLKERDEIIKSLVTGKKEAPKKGLLDDLNAKRTANNVKW